MSERENWQGRLVLLLCGIYCSTIGYAAEEEEDQRNEIAASLSLVRQAGDNDVAFGLEYERRFSESFGVGMLVERIQGNHDATIYALPLTLHIERWKLILAPGVEKSHGHAEFWLRVGSGYEFEVGKAIVSPLLALDFVDGETVYVVGATIGFGF